MVPVPQVKMENVLRTAAGGGVSDVAAKAVTSRITRAAGQTTVSARVVFTSRSAADAFATKKVSECTKGWLRPSTPLHPPATRRVSWPLVAFDCQLRPHPPCAALQTSKANYIRSRCLCTLCMHAGACCQRHGRLAGGYS